MADQTPPVPTGRQVALAIIEEAILDRLAKGDSFSRSEIAIACWAEIAQDPGRALKLLSPYGPRLITPWVVEVIHRYRDQAVEAGDLVIPRDQIDTLALTLTPEALQRSAYERWTENVRAGQDKILMCMTRAELRGVIARRKRKMAGDAVRLRMLEHIYDGLIHDDQRVDERYTWEEVCALRQKIETGQEVGQRLAAD